MRKLATAAIAFSAAVFIAHYLVPSDYWLLSAGLCCLLSLTAFFVKGDARRRVLLISIASVLGFFVSFISYSFKTLPAHELSGTELTVAATVTEYPNVYDDYSTVKVRLIGDRVPHVGALLYLSEGELPELAPGDKITVDVKLKTSDQRYGESYSGRIADNVYLLGYIRGEPEVTGKSAIRFLYLPQILANRVNEYAVSVFPGDTAPFMTALLTGDTTLIYEDDTLYANMAESGLMHIVAVSGMNVAFLIGFIMMTVRRKRLASFIGIPVICLFVLFAGATPSVCRAAFMQIMVLSAPLIRRENDGITSLTAVLAILLLINPNACASIGLQLSFAATLGIILVTPKINKALTDRLISRRKNSAGIKDYAFKWRDKAINGVITAFASTVGALVFTTPISIIYFGYVSLIGILVNILVFWAVSVAFILGYISCFLGMLWLPAGGILGALTSLFVRYIIIMAKLGASVPYGAIYTKDNVFGYWVLLVYAIFVLCYVFRREKGFRPVIPVCLCATSLCCVILFSQIAAAGDAGSFTACDVGQGQSLILTCGKATAVIDCGGKNTATNAGDTVTGILIGGGRQTVDVLALTHFDDDHVNGVVRLLSRVKVRRLVIPDVTEETKADIDEIITAAEKQGTQVYIIREDTIISAGNIEIDAYPVTSQEQQAMIYMESVGDFEAFISGDAEQSVEKHFVATHALPDTELYVAGHHGSKTSSSEELISALHAEYAVISVGYNTYGHPAPETLERLENAEMKILRTDENGNIVIKLKERSEAA